MRPGRRLRAGRRGRASTPTSRSRIETDAVGPDGRRRRASPARGGGDVEAALERAGHVPLPPYIRRPDRPRTASATRPSTRASRAASPRPPPACTSRPRCSTRLRARAASSLAEIVLHVGPGHLPAGHGASDVEDHRVEPEPYVVPAETAARRSPPRARRGGRVVAVGTTSVRTLEASARDGRPRAARARARPTLVIVPGFTLPGGGRAGHELPPAALVAAPAGGRLRRARARAGRLRGGGARAGYRFYSYGDAMLLELSGRVRTRGARRRACVRDARPASAAGPRSAPARPATAASRCTRRSGGPQLRGRVADLGQQAQEARGVEARVGGAQRLHGQRAQAARRAPLRRRRAAPRRRGPRARAASGRSRRRWPAAGAASPRAAGADHDGPGLLRPVLARPRPAPARASRACPRAAPTSPRMRCTSWGTTIAPVAGGGSSPITRSRSSFSPNERARRDASCDRSRLDSRPVGRRIGECVGPRAARGHTATARVEAERTRLRAVRVKLGLPALTSTATHKPVAHASDQGQRPAAGTS